MTTVLVLLHLRSGEVDLKERGDGELLQRDTTDAEADIGNNEVGSADGDMVPA
jgi:hypothetical protein